MHVIDLLYNRFQLKFTEKPPKILCKIEFLSAILIYFKGVVYQEDKILTP